MHDAYFYVFGAACVAQRIKLLDLVVGDILSVQRNDVLPCDGLLISAQISVTEPQSGSKPRLMAKTAVDPFVVQGSCIQAGNGTMLVLTVGSNHHTSSSDIAALSPHKRCFNPVKHAEQNCKSQETPSTWSSWLPWQIVTAAADSVLTAIEYTVTECKSWSNLLAPSDRDESAITKATLNTCIKHSDVVALITAMLKILPALRQHEVMLMQVLDAVWPRGTQKTVQEVLEMLKARKTVKLCIHAAADNLIPERGWFGLLHEPLTGIMSTKVEQSCHETLVSLVPTLEKLFKIGFEVPESRIRAAAWLAKVYQHKCDKSHKQV